MPRARVGLASVLCASVVAALSAQSPAHVVVPRVIAAAVPQFPRQALEAGASGAVVVQVTTDGKRVTDARITQSMDMPQPLVDAAVRNVRTWRFSPHVPVKFNVTYRYTIVDRPCDRLGRDTHNAAEIHFPATVDVFAERDPACPGATRLPPVFGIYVHSAMVPFFPPAALASGIEGDVTIGVTYKAVLSVASGPEAIAEPIMDGIRETWMYNPAPYGEEFRFRFKLEDGECHGGPEVVVGPGLTSYEIRDKRSCKGQ